MHKQVEPIPNKPSAPRKRRTMLAPAAYSETMMPALRLARASRWTRKIAKTWIFVSVLYAQNTYMFVFTRGVMSKFLKIVVYRFLERYTFFYSVFRIFHFPRYITQPKNRSPNSYFRD